MTVMPLTSSSFETASLPGLQRAVPVRHTRPVPIAGAQVRVEPVALQLIDDRSGFNALEAEWTALFERAGRPEQVFQSFGWLWHWCNHFLAPRGAKPTLAIVTGHRDGRLVLVCPFVVTRAGGLNTLSFMGDPVSQYGDVIVEDGLEAARDISAAFDFVLEQAAIDLVHLRKVRADAAIAPLLRARGAGFTDVQQAPYVAFEGTSDYAAFEQRYAKAARKNRKRQMRRLQETGETWFQRFAAGPAASDAASAALRLKRDWLRQRGLVSPAVADVRTEGFFRDCASGRGPASGIEIGAVVSGGSIAAIEIGIQCKNRVALHLIAYDPRFEKTGAGALLMEDSIRRACQQGKAALDLLAPGAAYKFEWADRSVDVGDCAFGLSRAGKVYASLYLARLRPAAKAMLEHLPKAVRRHIATFAGLALLLTQRGEVI
ncbi:MAG: cellulose biosynthesis protein CelD [Hyphomicrobium sp.]|nr:cellulose biosynthesis protein CelD [Hyphomicrobium sp.]PPD06136.1 MAG: cellulose biosynthesis protein CelD [Hyphomicrobium sp.]